MSGLVDEIKVHLVAAVKAAHARGPSSVGHANGPYHHADEMVVDLLHDVIANGVEEPKHGEKRLYASQSGAVAIECLCGTSTGSYPTATMAVSALQTHIFEATR